MENISIYNVPSSGGSEDRTNTEAAANALFTRQVQLDHLMMAAREKGQRVRYSDLAAELAHVRAERQRVLRGGR
jgi:hypothetical protein